LIEIPVVGDADIEFLSLNETVGQLQNDLIFLCLLKVESSKPEVLAPDQGSCLHDGINNLVENMLISRNKDFTVRFLG
jgi:hypothetical protein